jgi:hypothetical protein
MDTSLRLGRGRLLQPVERAGGAFKVSAKNLEAAERGQKGMLAMPARVLKLLAANKPRSALGRL